MNCRDYEDAASVFQPADCQLLLGAGGPPLDLRGFCGCCSEELLPEKEETVCTLCGNKDAVLPDIVVPAMAEESCKDIATLALFVTAPGYCMQAIQPLEQLCCNVTEPEVVIDPPMSTTAPSIAPMTMHPTQCESSPDVGRYGSEASTISLLCTFKALILLAMPLLGVAD